MVGSDSQSGMTNPKPFKSPLLPWDEATNQADVTAGQFGPLVFAVEKTPEWDRLPFMHTGSYAEEELVRYKVLIYFEHATIYAHAGKCLN